MEHSLRARVRDGDPEAFSALFREHAQAVYGHAARLTADRNTAEDVVSLTFLEAWRLREKLLSDAELEGEDGHGGDGHGGGGHGDRGGGGRGDGGGGDGSLRAWLFGIATNVLRNTRRAARRHSAALARLPERHADRETVPDFADALVGRMEDADRLAAAHAALARLRRREREVFALCVWSGLSYAAAAEALGVPVSTVRSRLARARQRLRGLAEAELARSPGRRPEQRGRTRPLPGGGQVPVDRTDPVRPAPAQAPAQAETPVQAQAQERGR
ncbi:RNA polymerase sigma factor [Streptomyces caniscabiei]|uniref:RNA polymerase sigma factor n=1 Tax=Streptomyces caniscabiei TaxID=2746961 RepID=UPI0029A7D160|nr:RNA polymerase sigma factor [Streptomyces caniscabiei]MDX2606626.1 RNA polymerase sigma factor [Streptomyces caniscabiei]MDX2739564.1 RNA polymerase sigma factor [Streptomyces caniscabiei]MDX2783850.1 RNA polymerase sigma factor [Streptomyces caniscabiei]